MTQEEMLAALGQVESDWSRGGRGRGRSRGPGPTEPESLPPISPGAVTATDKYERAYNIGVLMSESKRPIDAIVVASSGFNRSADVFSAPLARREGYTGIFWDDPAARHLRASFLKFAETGSFSRGDLRRVPCSGL